MAKTARYPTRLTPEAPPPAVPSPATERASNVSMLARWVGAVALISFSVWMVVLTTRQFAAEKTWFVASEMQRRDVDKRSRPVELRQAYNLDPDHPEIMRAFAESLLSTEQNKYATARWDALSVESFEEALAIYRRALVIYPSRPVAARNVGEAGLILSDIHRHFGNTEKAKEEQERAFSSFLYAARLMPSPTQRGPELRADMVRVAASVGRDQVAAEYLHEMAHRRERALLQQRQMTSTAVQSWLSLGLYAQIATEVADALRANPEHEWVNARLSVLARDPALSDALLHVLSELESQDRLTPRARGVLDQLRGGPARQADE